jgi:hypothetical protein
MANVRCQIVKAFNQYKAGEVKSLDQAVAEKWAALGLLEIMDPAAKAAAGPPANKAITAADVAKATEEPAETTDPATEPAPEASTEEAQAEPKAAKGKK